MAQDRTFGRRISVDARDANYPMRQAMVPARVPVSRFYRIPSQMPLDQGHTGTCVAQAWTGFMLAAPLMNKRAPSPFDTYRAIVAMDEYPDNDAEATKPDAELQLGSSVRAGAKYLQSQGRLKTYVWAATAAEAALWLLGDHGTIVVGSTWFWGMTDVPVNGIVRLEGGVQGGHAYLLIGYNRSTRMFRGVNSWGLKWGQQGRFWLKHDDLDTLHADGGELCAAVESLPA